MARGGRLPYLPLEGDRRQVIVESDYRGHRIEVNAVADDERWNADVMVRRTLSFEKPLHERVSCYKLTASHAEQAGMLWARRWIDSRLYLDG